MGFFSRKIKGQTKEAESGTQTQSVTVFWMEPLRQVPVQSEEVRFVFVMALDKSEAAAQSDFDAAKNVIRNFGKIS